MNDGRLHKDPIYVEFSFHTHIKANITQSDFFRRTNENMQPISHKKVDFCVAVFKMRPTES